MITTGRILAIWLAGLWAAIVVMRLIEYVIDSRLPV